MKLTLEMKASLLAAYNPEAIILFGSPGRGEADEFRDVDLLLVMEPDLYAPLIHDIESDFPGRTDAVVWPQP